MNSTQAAIVQAIIGACEALPGWTVDDVIRRAKRMTIDVSPNAGYISDADLLQRLQKLLQDVRPAGQAPTFRFDYTTGKDPIPKPPKFKADVMVFVRKPSKTERFFVGIRDAYSDAERLGEANCAPGDSYQIERHVRRVS